MISAFLASSPVSQLRATSAGDRRNDPDEQQLQRGEDDARQSSSDPKAVSGRQGNVQPLSAEAVLALQSANETSAITSDTEQSSEDKEGPDGDGLDPAEEKQVDKLKQRDREVRAHEQAHARVGGAYAGAPSYTFQQGPDGKRYAIGGEVQIDTSTERTPEATIRKMQVVIRAATAPAEPSSQDLKVAQQARAQLSEAQAQLRQQKTEELTGEDDSANSSSPASETKGSSTGEQGATRGTGSGPETGTREDKSNVLTPDFLAAYDRASQSRSADQPGRLADIRVA
ncbi:putative metalloprotease CJM1_0395 family protein [Roseibium sediminis]|uniref:putative metalloprotease CJM1_0395 family protein n=1 Tax=Roseibium sediminis TaxID=1775174 RepID=UPI00123D810F|nr:putative metalloprotease CJM1_0395 family protein [Roseibium sediminis]